MPSIIIVDDDYNNTKLMSMLLEMDGFQVTVSPNVQHAKKNAGADVDAFVIDVYLSPGEDGIAFLKQIRQGATAAPSNIPVIMTSGDDRKMETAREAGATDFLLKPFSPTDLSHELTKLLS